MDITMAYEVIRLHRKGFTAQIFDPCDPASDETLIYRRIHTSRDHGRIDCVTAVQSRAGRT